MANLPQCPPSLKPIAHFLKTAQEHDERDPIVAYWCRLYGLQTGLKLSTKQPEETALFIAIMDWLEKVKKEHHDNEAITNDVVAQAYLENYALKLFTYADQNDRAANFNKNVVKAYYTAGVIYDALLTFGELSEEATDKRKYAKYKAAYIHTCLKNGETPIPGPPNENEGESDDNNAGVGPSTSGNDETPSTPPAPPTDQEPSTNFQSDPPPVEPIVFHPHPNPTEINADKLPSPPVDPEVRNPGGFQPYVPTSATTIPKYEPPPANVALTPEQMAKAQKYCKYAGSALNFDDVKSAIENLEKALYLLSTGNEKNNGRLHEETAKPYDSMPGPSVLTMFARFLPGGKYHKTNLLELHRKFKDEYGPIIRLPGFLRNREVVMITDPNDFELLFRSEGVWPTRRGIATFDHYRKELRPDVFKNMGGLLSEQGESWGKMRSVVSPIMLKPATVNAYVPRVDDIAIEFCDRVKTLRDDKNELPANFMWELNKWSLESIASIALNKRLHILNGRKEDQSSRAGQLIKAVDDFFTLSFELEMLPSLWRYMPTPKFNELMKVFDIMTESTLYYVDEAMEEFEKNPPSEQNREPSVLEKLLKIDKHVAVVMALDMFLAGVDTTSSSTTNLMYYLAKNPDKQEKLRQEVQGLQLDANGKLTPSSFLKVPYLRACLKEVMRLAPIVGGTARAAGRDLVIKGYQVPKGTDVVMSNMLLHCDQNHFKNPTDFMPERWLKENIPDACPEAKASNPFVFIPFGFGPRACIGKRFAEMEINVLLTRLLKQFRIEYHYEPLKYRYSFVQSPISDLKFKLIEI